MLDSFLTSLIFFLNKFSSLFIAFIEFFVLSSFVLIFFKCWKKEGLFTLSALLIILSNIQVQRLTHYSFLSEPVALGTIAFGVNFLVSDMIVEFYGKEAAKKNILLSFFSQVFVIISMVIIIGYPLPKEETLPFALKKFSSGGHEAMCHLFIPSLRILLASLISYFLSQRFDIFIFQGIKNLSGDRFIWLRSFLSTSLSNFIDTALFSYFSWYFFNPQRISYYSLFVTFILGTYLIRIIIAILSIPILYMSAYFHKKIP